MEGDHFMEGENYYKPATFEQVTIVMPVSALNSAFAAHYDRDGSI
jgi:hypothetical protein